MNLLRWLGEIVLGPSLVRPRIALQPSRRMPMPLKHLDGSVSIDSFNLGKNVTEQEVEAFRQFYESEMASYRGKLFS